MSPYELLFAGGSVEHMNNEAGQVWLKRILDNFSSAAWLNPLEKNHWYSQSINMINEITNKRMHPLSIHGITDAITNLL